MARDSRPLLVGPTAVALSLVAVGCGSSERPAVDAAIPDAPSADAGADGGGPAPAVPTTESAFGIFASFTREFAAYERAAGLTHPQYLAWAAEQHEQLGARWTRSNLQLLWDVVEPEPAAGYRWDNEMGTEECFGAAAAAGVHYLAVFHEGGLLDAALRHPLEQRESYQRFVRDVVERYDGDGVDDAPGDIRITHWQVGNETPPFAQRADGAATYAEWFTVTAEAVRQADPTAKLVLVGSTDSRTVDPLHRDVIERLAAAGVRFDAIDVHHWGSAAEVTLASAPAYRALLEGRGLDDVELWSTEHGTHVGSPSPPAGTCTPACPADQICVQVGPMARCLPPCASDAVCPPAAPTCDRDSGFCTAPSQSLADQARSLVERYVVNRDQGVARILWNNLVAWQAFGGQAGGVYDRMGLVSGGDLELETEADRGRPRPSWFAYRALAARTDEIVAERLGPVEGADAAAYVSAYRARGSGRVGWVAWAREGTAAVERDTSGAPVQVTSFVTDAAGTPVRDETLEASSAGIVSIGLDADPVWIEPVP